MANPRDEGRVARERDFHDDLYASDTSRSSQAKYYCAVSDGVDDYVRSYQDVAWGRDVLAYGCGDTRNILALAPDVNSLHGIDISSEAIQQLKSENTYDNVSLHVMDAMDMTFPDDSFDLVFGAGILHHLDTEIAFQEVARVLRRNGRAVFWEPLGLNPLINAYRRLTPEARTPDEHPLVPADFAIMAKHLNLIDVRYYGLSTLAAVPLRKTRLGKTLLRVGGRVDRALFTLPGVHRLAWYALLIGTAK